MGRFAVRVIPKAGTDEVAGLRAGELVVRVTAAPDAGKANAAVLRVVARFLDVAPTSVTIVRGQASRHKVLSVDALDDSDIASALERVPRLG